MARVMGALGYCVASTRIVTMKKKGVVDEGLNFGDDVVRVRPSFTTGLVCL